jgi:signal transduction histidine kinase
MTQAARIRQFASLAVIGTCAIGAPLLINTLAPHWTWNHPPLHAVLESFGAFAALNIALLILLLHRYGRLQPGHWWLATGLIGMGVLDGFHAATPAGTAFVWLHSMATFVGGLLFACIWLPNVVTTYRAVRMLPGVILLCSIALGAFSVAFPELLPAMNDEHGFTFVAKALNVVGGAGFLAATLYFVALRYCQRWADTLIWANQCLLFGSAGILFVQSMPWNGDWWLLHGFRALAYGVMFCYFFVLYHWRQVRLQQSQELLQRRVEERTTELAQANDNLKCQVTERQLAEKKLTANADELERSNAELEQFAYVASHDLKAPLRAIDNLSKWIEEDLKDVLVGEARENMELIRGRVARLEALLDDLLAYSRAGRIGTEVAPVDTAAMVDEIVALLDPPEGFTVSVSGELPKFSTANGPLEQVLRNLIGNAIKHHDRTTGHANVSVEDRGDFYEFAVTDDGLGIPPELQDRAFRMFETLKPRDEVEGSGMGLAIVKKVVEWQGGRVWIESETGSRGATFRFIWKKHWQDKEAGACLATTP